MKNLALINCTELNANDSLKINAGYGPIVDGIEWYYKTVGSFYRGIWDGLTGKQSAV